MQLSPFGYAPSHAPSSMMDAPTMLPVEAPSGPFSPGGRVPSAMVDAPTMLPMAADVAMPPADADQYRAARRGAGTGLILATAGTGAGLWLGGPLGARAGLLLIGAAPEAPRATPDWRTATHPTPTQART